MHALLFLDYPFLGMLWRWNYDVIPFVFPCRLWGVCAVEWIDIKIDGSWS